MTTALVDTPAAVPPQKPLGGFARLEAAQRAAQLTQADDAALRRTLNALAVTSELMDALVVYPGDQGNDEDLVVSARAMLDAANAASAEFLSLLNLKPGEVPWAHHMILRCMMRAVARRWTETAARGEVSADISFLEPVWRVVVAADVPAPGARPMGADDTIALRIAWFDALTPVMKEIELFDFFVPQAESIAVAATAISDAAAQAAKEIAGPAASPTTVQQLVQSLVRNGGALYAASWREATERAVRSLMDLQPEQIEAYVAAHPDTCSPTAVNAFYRAAFGRLIDAVKFLVPPRRTASPASSAIEAQGSV